MNLDELRTFLKVVETRNLAAAAQQLNVTASTVTARINSLEEELGQRLLHRKKSGTDLTSPGFKFKRYAEVMVQLWGQARSEVSLPKGYASACNLGLEFDLWRGPGERFLDHVRKQSPDVALAFWPGDQRNIERWLSIGLVDVAFCFAPLAGDEFENRLLFEETLYMMSRDPAYRSGLDANYVYVDHGEAFRRDHAAAFPGDVSLPLTIASSEWAVEHLLREGGAGYLSLRHVPPGRLHVIADAPVFTRRVYAVEKKQTVKGWPWYAAALSHACGTAWRPSGTMAQ